MCRSVKHTITATSALTHQDLFRWWQQADWSFASPGIHFGGPNDPPNFTTGHWVNSAIDNAWEFDTAFPPSRTHGITNGWPWVHYDSSARFKLCVFHVGCVRNQEVGIWQTVRPATGDFGYDTGERT